MLIQFTVENHRSIKNSAVISFAASKDKSFDEYLLRPDEKTADYGRKMRGGKRYESRQLVN